MREKTERPEAVEAGTVKLVGTDHGRIVAEAARLLDDDAEYATHVPHPQPLRRRPRQRADCHDHGRVLGRERTYDVDSVNNRRVKAAAFS